MGIAVAIALRTDGIGYLVSSILPEGGTFSLACEGVLIVDFQESWQGDDGILARRMLFLLEMHEEIQACVCYQDAAL